MRDEHNRPIAGRSILDPKVYWMLSGKDNANAVFLPFDSANRIVATLPSDFAQYLWGAKAAFSYRTEDGAATGSILMPVVCPNSVAVPSLRECAVPLSMGTHVFLKDIFPKGGGSELPERGMYFLFDAAQRLSQSLDYYDVNRPIIITAVSTAQGQAIIAAGNERQRKLQEQDALAKNQAAEQRRLAAEAEIQRGRSTLQAAKKGATLFCASPSPVHTGMQTSDVTYRCDLTGEAQWPVRDLLALNWDISNESRTPVDGNSGDASVSLILKKQ